jgi:transcriptional regulator with GAF, ATPase, and Fis domain
VFWSKSGVPVAVEYKSTPVTENNLLIGAVVIFRDITQRKSTQAKLLNAIKEVDTLKERLEMDNAYLLEELNADFNHHQIIGQSMQVQHMVNQIELVGATNANVIITGESGTGKELIARAIHEVSDRKSRPLIRVNCAAIPADLFESEFFGHVKGAFSGAISDRIGRFELADGATIFLDEVGEIPLQLQGKLLRVLQEQQFERVGESKTRHVDVRVISATNQKLKTLVQQNKFREDLYFRLNVFPIHSPALRERIDDIPLLVNHFIDKVCLNFNRPKPQVSVSQMQYLTQYHWPGNIRELENIIERQIILAKSNKINFEFLASESVFNDEPFNPKIAPQLMRVEEQKALEKNNLANALKHCQGKIYGEDGAAQLLGLKPTTLASKLKKYGLNRREFTP